MEKDRRTVIEMRIRDGVETRKRIAGFNRFLRLLKTKDIESTLIFTSNMVIFDVKSLDELSAMRAELRREFFSWEDNLEGVSCWYSDTFEDYWVRFSWMGKKLPIRIDLELKYKELPEELKSLSEGCHFEETITPIEAKGATESRMLSYVCNKK